MKSLLVFFLAICFIKPLFAGESTSLSSDTMQELICEANTPSMDWCVKVKEANEQERWIHWTIARKFYGINKIIEFSNINLILDQGNLTAEKKSDLLEHVISLPKEFKLLSNNHFTALWREETEKSAIKRTEPNYLAKLSNLMDLRIKKFAEVQQMPVTKEALSNHAFSTLFTMKAYLYLIRNNALRGSWKSNINTTGSYKSLHRSYDFASDICKDVADEAKLGDALEAVINYAYFKILKAKNFGCEEIEKVKNSERPFEEIVLISDRISEKYSWIYSLKHFDEIIGETYDIASFELFNKWTYNVFDSERRWEEIKDLHLEQVPTEMRYILTPWLDEIDRTAKSIKQFL